MLRQSDFMKLEKERTIKEFMIIPGVGKKTSEDFWKLGLRSIKDLEGKDPNELYEKLCLIEGKNIDMCMLYVIKTAVYYASNTLHDPELLKWWNWKNRKW